MGSRPHGLEAALRWRGLRGGENKRQPYCKGTTAPRARALGINGPTMHAHQFPDQVQADPQTATGVLLVDRQLHEHVENLLERFGRNADTVVLHGDDSPVV